MDKGTVERGIERELYFTEPYISPISSGLRWRGERDIPKNVFFLREEGLIYDAPESAYIPKNVSFLREEVLIYVFSSSARRF